MAEGVSANGDQDGYGFLALAQDLAAAAAQFVDPDTCLRRLRLGLIRLGFSRAGIWVVDPRNPHCLSGSWGTGWRGEEVDEHGIQFPFGPFIASDRIAGGAKIVLRRLTRPPDISAPAHWSVALDDGGLPNNACVALRADDRLLGIVSVDMLPSDRVIHQDHVRMLDLLADIVATALARSRAEIALREANDTLRNEIAERRRAEEQFRQAQKMEAIGRLAGGIAHDFNNLLTVIGGYASLLSRRLPQGSREQAAAEQIRRASDSAATLTRQLLAFSRRQLIAPRETDLNAIVLRSSQMLRRLIGEDITLLTDLSAELGTVRVDPGQIEQVLMNLAVNARDAMPSGGRLTIETANLARKAEAGETQTAAAEGGEANSATFGRYVMLAVHDTGVGIDELTRAHLFEPFFTTKPLGKGTGLGLAAVFGIIEQSGGSIEVASEVGQGASFRLYFPQVNGPSLRSDQQPGQGEPPRGQETILLVEDEPPLRTLVGAILESAGYTVLSAGSGDEALTRAKDYYSPIDLLLTDVVLPGLSGRQLAERLAPDRPGLRVLYMSGYTDGVVRRYGIFSPDSAYLTKPFDPLTIATKIRQVLDATSLGCRPR